MAKRQQSLTQQTHTDKMSVRARDDPTASYLLKKKAKEAKRNTYKWTDGEEVVNVSFCNTGDGENLLFIVPRKYVNKVLMRGIEASAKRNFSFTVDDTETFEDFFDTASITKAEYTKLTENDDDGEDGDDVDGDGEDDDGDEDNEEDDEEEMDDHDKDEAIALIGEWVSTLPKLDNNDPPTTAVYIIAHVGFLETC